MEFRFVYSFPNNVGVAQSKNTTLTNSCNFKARKKIAGIHSICIRKYTKITHACPFTKPHTAYTHVYMLCPYVYAHKHSFSYEMFAFIQSKLVSFVYTQHVNLLVIFILFFVQSFSVRLFMSITLVDWTPTMFIIIVLNAFFCLAIVAARAGAYS